MLVLEHTIMYECSTITVSYCVFPGSSRDRVATKIQMTLKSFRITKNSALHQQTEQRGPGSKVPAARTVRPSPHQSRSTFIGSHVFYESGCKRLKKCKDVAVASSPSGSVSTLEETAALDGLIDILLSAKDTQELGKGVADNLLAFDQKFWIRLATRNDTASSEEEKNRIGDLAGQVMRMVEALVKQSDHQITDSSSVLQNILAAAADERGEWHVPLSDDCLEAMRKEMDANAGRLDESLLATATAWMRKADKDNLDGMVALLQHVLQLYAARALVSQKSGEETDDQVLDTVLSSRETTWLHHIKSAADAGEVNGNSFLTAVRRRMESIVLALPSGSNAQRIQAEYLKEVESRAETLFKELNC